MCSVGGAPGMWLETTGLVYVRCITCFSPLDGSASSVLR